MATKNVTASNDLQGYSSDEKPNAADGTLYHVIDTGDVYVCHEGNWQKDLRMARAISDATFL